MAQKNLEIICGDTFTQIVRWESAQVTYRPIIAITNEAPALLTVPSHGLPSGWRARVESVVGMTQINSSDGWYSVSNVNSNQINLDVNSSGFKPYVSGGYLVFNAPQVLSGYTGRMSIKDKVGGTELFRLDSSNGRIVVDDASKTITLNIEAADTALMTFKKAVYSLELVSGAGGVTTLLSGSVVVTQVATNS